jgi:ADP-heptose:LPS heptosyltransferase
VLRALRTWYPDARIELLVSRPNRAVAGAVGRFVDQVWIYQKTVRSAVCLLRALRRARYDVIVDLVDHPSTNAQLTIRWCRPRAAVGLLHAEPGLYTHAAPTLDPAVVHPVERFAQLLLPFGIDPATEPLDLEYPLTRADLARARAVVGPCGRSFRLGVNLSGRQPERHWGAQNYVALIRELTVRHPQFEIWVCGAPQDAAEVARIATEAGARAVPAQPSLNEFAAVHIAAAFKLPSVVLYHPEPGVAPWIPYHTPHRAVVGVSGIPSIPVATVADAVKALIAEVERAGEKA